MAPELHYQLIISRVAGLHAEAGEQRRARQAASGRKAQAHGSQHRLRAAFGKLRTS